MERIYHILVIDDIAANRFALAALLSQLSEVMILEADSGEQALSMTIEHRIDLILLDIQMPGMDGYEVAHHLKMTASTREIPIIFITAVFKAEEFACQGYQIGAVDYLTKPVDDNLLLNRIRHYVKLFDREYTLRQTLTALQEKDRDLRRANEALRAQLQERTVELNRSSEAIISADSGGNIIFWNQGAALIFGYKEKEVLGQSLTMLIPEKYREPHLKGLERVRDTGESRLVGQIIKLVGMRKDGTEFPFELSLSSWIVSDKRYFSAVGRDITERIQQENQTRRFLQTQTVINALLQSSTEPYSLDKQLGIALNLILFGDWIPTLKQGAIFLHDQDKRELVLQTQIGLADCLLKTCARVSFGECLCGKVLETETIVFVNSMDKNHTIQYKNMKPHGHYCVPIKSRARLLGVLTIYVEEGHVKNAEEEEFLNAIANSLSGIIERRQLDEKLQQAKIQAEQANVTKSRFLASMSHEIRTPINAILGMGEVLSGSQLNQDQRRYVQVINQAGDSLLALINDILDLSKIEAGQLELDYTPFSPVELAEKSLSILQNKAESQGTDLHADFDVSIPRTILSDPQRVQQILLNLLSNAIKFTKKGKVTLSVVKTSNTSIRFSVSDTGIGIPADRQTVIFEPFIQADSTTSRRFGGTGLGLSICHKLTEKMRGKIWVVSKPDQGSVFHVEIPFQETTVGESTEGIAGFQSQTVSGTGTVGLSILLADDAEENCIVIEAYLRDTPHRLTIVENGHQALKQFKENDFDLVLMDIQMPGMDGYDATREIRIWERDNNLLPTPILALTANAMRDDMEKTREAGCDLHLSKPIRKKRLLEVIDTFVR